MQKKHKHLFAISLILVALLLGAWTYVEIFPDVWVWMPDVGDWDPYECAFYGDCEWRATVCNPSARNELVGIYFDPATAPYDLIHFNDWWPAVPCPTLGGMGTCSLKVLDPHSWQGEDNPIHATAHGELTYLKFIEFTDDGAYVAGFIYLEPGTLVKNADGTVSGQFINRQTIEPGKEYHVSCGGSGSNPEAGPLLRHRILRLGEQP